MKNSVEDFTGAYDENGEPAGYTKFGPYARRIDYKKMAIIFAVLAFRQECLAR